MAKATIPSLKKVAQAAGKTAISTQLDLQDPQTREDVMKALGIEEPKPQLSIFDRITGVLDALRFTDDIRKAQKEGNILSGVGDFLLDIPKALGGAITGTDYRDETDKEGGAEILEGIGAQGLVKNIGGFVLDVLADPTTYVSLGTGSGAKILTKEGAKTLTKSGTKLFNQFTREGVEQLAKASADEVAELAAREGLEIAGKGAREIAEQMATKKVMDFSKKGVKVLQDLGLDETNKVVQQVLKEGVIDSGGFKFAGKKLFDMTPEVEKVLNLYFNPVKGVDQNLRSIPGVGQKYAQGVEAIGKGVSNIMAGATDTIRNLFDRRYNITGGNARFNPLYDFMQQSEDFLKGKSQDVIEQFTGEYKQILDAFENPEILPYILEDTPIDKLQKLPDNLKKSLTGALKQIKSEEEAFQAVESVLKPRAIAEMDIPDDVKPLAEIAKKSNTFADFKSRVDRALKSGGLKIPDQLTLGDGNLDIAKFRTLTEGAEPFAQIDNAIKQQGMELQKRADEILVSEGPDSLNYKFALTKAKGYGTGIASGIDNARLNYISKNIKDSQEAGRLIKIIEQTTDAPNVKESIDAVLKIRPDVAPIYDQIQVPKFRVKPKEKLPVSVMREFADFIDYARGISKPPLHSGFKDVYDYEGAIRELAEQYGINSEMSNGRLANKLANILDQNDYAKTLTSTGGRLNAQTVLNMTKFRAPSELTKTINRKLSPEEVQEIIGLNQKIFKDENVGIVEKILTPTGQEALGKYNQGWVDIIAKQANAKDTYLHESVHKAIDLFIDKDRKDTLFKFVKDRFNLEGIAAEEKIAEDFINYVNGGTVKTNKGIRKIFDDILNFIRGITGNKDEVQKLYDDILGGNLTRQSPEITEDFFKALKKKIGTEDPLTSQLVEIGTFKNIIDKTGVKKKVFQNALSEQQIEFLNSKGIFTAQDLVDRAKSKNFYKLRDEAVEVISKKTAPQMTRLEAGKEPIIQALEAEIRELKTDPRFIELKDQYKALLGDANATGTDINKLAEQLGGPELVDEVDQYIRMRDQIQDLNFRKQEKITELVNRTTRTTIEKTGAFKPKASEFEEIATGLGITPDKLKTIIKQAKDAASGKLNKVGRQADAEKLLSKVYEIKDPVQKEIITRNIERIANNTETMLEVGAISGSSKARYLGRDYLITPSGKNLEETKGIASIFGSAGMKSKLDPRSATSQKQRIYDYLADVIDAGGKTKLTETSGKEFTANLAEQLARDEMKALSAKEYKRLADSIINNKITDPAGNPLYKKVGDIVSELQEEGVELSDKLKKAVQTYNKTGKLPEQLKEFFKNRGYSQLTQKGGGVIPVFQNVFFDAETHDILSKMHNQFFGEETFNEFVKMYDKVHNAIKASQTAWFPAFHVRNMFSNVFTNFVEGVKNPQMYKDAQLIQKYNNVLEKIPLADVKEGDKLQKLLKEIGDKTIKLGDTGSYKISELHQLARYNAVISGGIYGDLSENLLNKGGNLGVKSANPLSQDFVLSQVGRKVGSSIEDNARIALFIDRLSKGYDVRSAALKVKEVLFDYQDLTDFERNIMRRFVPFYTWTKKNAVLQMKRIVKQPGVYTAYLKGFNELRDAFNDLTPEERDQLPAWVKQGVGIAFGNGGDNVSVIKQFGLPQEAFENLLETNPLNQLGIIPKSVLEIGTGQNIFKGKAIIDDTDGKAFRNFPQFIKDRMGYREEKRKTKDGKEYTVYYVDAWAKYYVNLLLGRTTSEFSKITNLGAEGDAPADLLNLFTGIKKYDFNLTEEKEKRNREKSKQLYDILINKGLAREYTNQYIPKEQKQSILSQMGQ